MFLQSVYFHPIKTLPQATYLYFSNKSLASSNPLFNNIEIPPRAISESSSPTSVSSLSEVDISVIVEFVAIF